MKIGILGTGMIVKDLLTTIEQLDFETISILGTEDTRVETEEIVRLHNLKECFFDYDKMLNSDIDTIYVALPNHLHYHFAKKALNANKHIILEKPATSSFHELIELKQLAVEKEKILIEAMTTHYLPAYRNIKQDIKSLGLLKIVSINYSQYSSRYKSFKQGNLLPAFDPKKSGGALMDLNVYNLHFSIGLFGKPNNIYYCANVERGIDTSGIMVLDYETFKVVCIGAKDCKAPIVSSIQGDEGNIVIYEPANQIQNYEKSSNSGSTEIKKFSEGKHRMFYEFKEFIRMIDEKDFQKANEMLDISMIVSEIMETGRKQEGIIFESDR